MLGSAFYDGLMLKVEIGEFKLARRCLMTVWTHQASRYRPVAEGAVSENAHTNLDMGASKFRILQHP
jgi:hypothetical protein